MGKEMTIFVFLLVSCSLGFSQDVQTANLVRAVSYDAFDANAIIVAVEAGGDVNHVEAGGSTGGMSVIGSLVLTASYERNLEQYAGEVSAIQYLAKHGVKLQAVDSTILYFPIASNKPDIVAALLDLGASATSWPNALIGNSFNMSPIQLATERGAEKIITLLTQHGAVGVSQNESMRLRLIYYADRADAPRVEQLLELGVPVNYANPDGKTPLIAVLDVLQFTADTSRTLLMLIQHGANPNLPGISMLLGYTTPLHLAVYATAHAYQAIRGTDFATEVLVALLQNGALVSGVDGAGRTPLHIAADMENLAAARLLLQAGCKVQPKDATGKTPLDYAKSAVMIALLKRYGATE